MSICPTFKSINNKFLIETEARSLLTADEGSRVCEVCQDVVIYTTTVWTFVTRILSKPSLAKL